MSKRERLSRFARLAIAAALATFTLSPMCAKAVSLAAFRVEGDAVIAPLAGLRGEPARGEAIIRDRRMGNCIICHAFPFKDEVFQGEIGPSLSNVGGRLSEGQIRLRLIDESVINPNTVMPPYYRVDRLNNVAPEYAGQPGLSAQQIEDVVSYLASMKE